jgi:hypothetical protein
MKKAIEKLLLARTQIVRGCPSEAIDILDYALEELKTPRWYTPERWEAETGKPWPDNGAVYVIHQKFEIDFYPDWYITNYLSAKYKKDRKEYAIAFIVCATEAGPPPDDWKPEEEKS